jgi:hypothetical protein
MHAYADQVPSGVRSPRVLVTAVTAPGVSEGMSWDENRCAALGSHRHGGELGCRVRTGAAMRWNETAAERWRAMHREAYQRCVREGSKPWLLVRVWEMQKRGLLHVHPVLAYSTAEEKRSADRYVALLDAIRRRYGFGYVERKRRVREPRAAAAYLSSYFVTGKGRKVSLQESVQSNWMPRSIIHVPVRLSQRSGITMRTLRIKRHLFRRIGPLLDVLRLDLDLSILDIYRALEAKVSMIDLVVNGYECRDP